MFVVNIHTSKHEMNKNSILYSVHDEKLSVHKYVRSVNMNEDLLLRKVHLNVLIVYV